MGNDIDYGTSDLVAVCPMNFERVAPAVTPLDLNPCPGIDKDYFAAD
jgi:hypothetical protein